MKVLVTGATGFLGSWIARELVAAGHEARALVRPTSTLTNLEGTPIERATGDVLDVTSVRRALEGCDAVVHSAGVAHFLPGDERRMYEVNASSVGIVLGAAHDAGIRRAVLTSTTAVMGGSREPRVWDETAESNAETLGIDYFISKLRGERAALEVGSRGLPLVVLRPTVLLGPGDIYGSSAHTFLALARRKLPVYVRGGASFCDVRDVARGHVAALERGRAGETYILGGHNLEIGEMVKIAARIAGVPAPRAAPYGVAYAVATAAEAVAAATRRKPDMSRQLVKASHLYTFASSAKAERELGYRTRAFEASLKDTLRFFIEAGRLAASTPELRTLGNGLTDRAETAGTARHTPVAMGS